LGWEDAIDLDAGIDETVAWADKYLEVLREQPDEYIHQK
tara:strand:- start:450 stop:566 length:117 start_codon:yes stop_codon:yes gene_type:complete